MFLRAQAEFLDILFSVSFPFYQASSSCLHLGFQRSTIFHIMWLFIYSAPSGNEFWSIGMRARDWISVVASTILQFLTMGLSSMLVELFRLLLTLIRLLFYFLSTLRRIIIGKLSLLIIYLWVLRYTWENAAARSILHINVTTMPYE